MREALLQLANGIADSVASELATQTLRGVAGLPPVLQTVHLLAVAVLMGSAVLMQWRVLGLAVNSQALRPLQQRLAPWAVGALVVLPLSMAPFFLARPHRYLLNPVFGIKMGMLLVALAASMAVWRLVARADDVSLLMRFTALLAMSAWLLTVLAGRWIAYADYLFWPA